jgi:hypothetical protein
MVDSFAVGANNAKDAILSLYINHVARGDLVLCFRTFHVLRHMKVRFLRAELKLAWIVWNRYTWMASTGLEYNDS